MVIHVPRTHCKENGFIAPPPTAKLRLVAPNETQSLIAQSQALRRRNRELRNDLRRSLDGLIDTEKRSFEVTAKIAESSEVLKQLTARERSVLALIAAGYSTKQVAARLGITFKTAVSHRTHIMEKLDIHETAGLTRFAIRHELVRA
jgi:DNA-binding NarL/FixJ family response regulator